jgi:hypothetical protein
MLSLVMFSLPVVSAWKDGTAEKWQVYKLVDYRVTFTHHIHTFPPSLGGKKKGPSSCLKMKGTPNHSVVMLRSRSP